WTEGLTERRGRAHSLLPGFPFLPEAAVAITCTSPDVERLRQLLHGQLPDAEVEALEEHLLRCDVCARALDRLSAEDALVTPLRARGGGAPLADGRVIAELVERAERLRPPEATTGGFSREDTPSHARHGDYLSMLAPPQGPGELGRLGPYRVLKILGAGGMGVVFEAEDTLLKRVVALKAMKPDLAASPIHHQRFLR